MYNLKKYKQLNEKLGLKPVITIKSTNITGIGSKEQPFQITN